MSQESVIQEIIEERKKQDEKWGEQDHDLCKWVSILAEEVGEVAAESLDRLPEGVPYGPYREELIHVAAVAIAAIESYDRIEREKW